MRRHALDPVSLVFGLAFTAAGVLFLAGQVDQAVRLRWLWPFLLLVLGIGILLDVGRRPREDAPVEGPPGAAEPAEPAEPPAEAAEPPAEAVEPAEPAPEPPAATRTAELDPEPRAATTTAELDPERPPDRNR